jgi:hypothetical protein
MSSQPTTFVDAVLEGRAEASSIDDWVDRWADSGGQPNGRQQGLDEYLGFDAAEGAAWAEEPSLLRLIIIARDQRQPFTELLDDREQLAAARAADPSSTPSVRRWLIRNGYLDADS